MANDVTFMIPTAQRFAAYLLLKEYYIIALLLMVVYAQPRALDFNLMFCTFACDCSFEFTGRTRALV